LAQYGEERPGGDAEVEQPGLEAGEAPAVDVSAATDTIALFPSETRAFPLPALPREVSPGPSDSAIAMAGDPPATPFTLSERDGIAVSPAAPAVAAPGPDDFAGEIAHLQALIEGLTRKIEWRTTSVTGR
jgi:hypothetical protein